MEIQLKDLSSKDLRGVYFIKNLITEQVYVGSVPKSTFRKRFKQHFNSLISNKHENTHLQRSYNKYGRNNFKFEIVEILEGNPNSILKREQYYLDNLQNIFNKHKNAFFPPKQTDSKGNQEKRNETFRIGHQYLKKYKDGIIKLEDIPDKYKGIVIGKSNFVPWNKGLTKKEISYDFLKGIPKTISPLSIEARKRASESNRNRSKKIYVFNYSGKFITSFRSVMDIVDYSKSNNELPIIVQSSKPRKCKTGFVPVEHLEVNNILKVLKGNQKHHKGLIFSFDQKVDYKLEPKDIKFNYKKWSQCYFLNHSCPKE